MGNFSGGDTVFAWQKCLRGKRDDLITLTFIKSTCLSNPWQLRCKAFKSNRIYQKNTPRKVGNFSGGDTGIRTLDPMIKSHLLYQLSYVSKTELRFSSTHIFTYKKKKIKKKMRFFVFYGMNSGTKSFIELENKMLFSILCLNS